MSLYSKGLNFDANKVQVGGYGGDVDIVCSNSGGKILINGVEPTGGSGGQLPLTGTGDISITGNITASGDGVTNGKIEGESMKSKGVLVVDGKLTVPTNDIEISTGKMIVSAGNIEQGGAGKIVSGSGGLESHGDIITIGAKDLIMGNNIYFEGTDIFKRTLNPQVDTSYKIFKGLVARNDSTVWTGTNDFADTVRLGTESGGTFTPSGLTLNTTGTLQSVNINNSTLLQCGNINCGNGGTNEIRCKKIITRTNEDDVNNPDGWTITQQAPSNPADGFDKVLDIKAAEAGGFCVIRSLDSQTGPNITLDPRTDALGGRVVCNEVALGNGGSSSFTMEQPKSGADVANALFQLGTSSSVLKFKDSTGNVDLMTLQQEVSTGDGLLLIRAIEFETNGNRIYQLRNGLTNLNVYFKQATEFHEFIFEDNQGGQIIRIRKTQVEFKENIPILFGQLPFQPIQYRLTRTITIAANADTTNFTNMAFNCRSDTWTKVNDGSTMSMYNVLLEGYYKCTITQTADSSSSNFSACDLMFDYILHLSIQTAPDIDITEPSFNYRKKPTNQARPTIRIDHLNNPVQSQPVFVLYPNQSAGETMPIEVRLTKLDF
jgi:hypothetical protein